MGSSYYTMTIYTHLAMLTMLIRGRDRYDEGHICDWHSGCVLRISSSSFLCHERATIKGVHLEPKKSKITEIGQQILIDKDNQHQDNMLNPKKTSSLSQ